MSTLQNIETSEDKVLFHNHSEYSRFGQSIRERIIISLKNWKVGHVHYRTQNICSTLVQCWIKVEDVGPTLYKCYTNVLCFTSGDENANYIFIG